MTVRYIQYARHRDVEVEVRASENIDYLTTGVQKIKGGELFSDNKGIVGSWGTDYPVNDSIKYGKQTVGLGVYVPVPYVKEYTEDKVNSLILMPYRKNDVLRFYLTSVSAKEEFNDVKTARQFFAYLENWRKGLTPVRVNY